MAQRHAPHGRLYFGQPPVGPKALMKPPESWRVPAAIYGIDALAMVFVSPCRFPERIVVGDNHSPFPGGGHNLVLTEGERPDIADGTDRPAFIARTVRLSA